MGSNEVTTALYCPDTAAGVKVERWNLLAR